VNTKDFFYRFSQGEAVFGYKKYGPGDAPKTKYYEKIMEMEDVRFGLVILKFKYFLYFYASILL